jgi:NTP pyrophosphatase (non-canonical NTP hydrolase)
MTQLSEEVGEVGREINYLHGPKKKKATEELGDLEAEVGDVFFTLTCLLHSHHLDLDKAFKKNNGKKAGER